MADQYEPGEFQPTTALAGMTPWVCEYDGPSGKFGITLYGANADQVLEDNCMELPGLKVLGELHSTAAARKIPDDE